MVRTNAYDGRGDGLRLKVACSPGAAIPPLVVLPPLPFSSNGRKNEIGKDGRERDISRNFEEGGC